MQKKFFVFFISLSILAAIQVFPFVSCLDQTEETESSVAELAAFHEIIYPIWHTAYPEKDYEALRKFVPEVNRLADDLYRAKLPGILRDRQAKWEEELEELKKTVEGYNKAASGVDNAALLNAAEALHAKFEMLVRIIRPVLKEVDEFHKVLYSVYHKYLPNGEIDKIREVSQDLIVKAEAITKAQLPKKLEAKKESFSAAAQELLHAAKGLREKCEMHNQQAIEKAVEILHTKYQNLEKICES